MYNLHERTSSRSIWCRGCRTPSVPERFTLTNSFDLLHFLPTPSFLPALETQDRGKTVLQGRYQSLFRQCLVDFPERDALLCEQNGLPDALLLRNAKIPGKKTVRNGERKRPVLNYRVRVAVLGRPNQFSPVDHDLVTAGCDETGQFHLISRPDQLTGAVVNIRGYARSEKSGYKAPGDYRIGRFDVRTHRGDGSGENTAVGQVLPVQHGPPSRRAPDPCDTVIGHGFEIELPEGILCLSQCDRSRMPGIKTYRYGTAGRAPIHYEKIGSHIERGRMLGIHNEPDRGIHGGKNSTYSRRKEYFLPSVPIPGTSNNVFAQEELMEPSAIGIDLGGTNLKGIIISQKGEWRHLTRIPTEAEKGGAHVMSNILSLIDQLIRKEGSSGHILGVGVGTPGFVGQDGTVDGAENLPGWKGTRLYIPIMERYGFKAIGANDATVAALAEARYGAGRGVRNMVLLTLGTGIGGGIVIDHKLYTGTFGMAGELGHIIVQTGGIQCNCGLRGCVERYASATGIVYLAKKFSDEVPAGKDTPFSALVKENPGAITSKAVYDFVNKGDMVALKVHETICEMLGRLIGIVCNFLSPDRIVLGGGVMNAGKIILDTVARYAAGNCWPMIWEKCDMVIAELSEDAGVLGAGAMVFDAFGGGLNVAI